jgi:hypothetical protein
MASGCKALAVQRGEVIARAHQHAGETCAAGVAALPVGERGGIGMASGVARDADLLHRGGEGLVALSQFR